MKDIPTSYANVSGQNINLAKSEMFFRRNVGQNNHRFITDLLGVREGLGSRKYLGMPSLNGRKKQVVFAFIKDKIWRKIKYVGKKSISGRIFKIWRTKLIAVAVLCSKLWKTSMSIKGLCLVYRIVGMISYGKKRQKILDKLS